MLVPTCRSPGCRVRRDDEQRAAGVFLNPLAEVEVGVLMAVPIRRSQLVVDFQCGGERRKAQEDPDHGQGDKPPEPGHAVATGLLFGWESHSVGP